MIDALSAALEDPPTPLTPEDIRRDGFGAAPWFVCFLAERDGQGIGRALMAALARHGRDLGAVWLIWDVWVGNDAAKAFYQALQAEAHPEVDVMALTGDALEALARSRT